MRIGHPVMQSSKLVVPEAAQVVAAEKQARAKHDAREQLESLRWPRAFIRARPALPHRPYMVRDGDSMATHQMSHRPRTQKHQLPSKHWSPLLARNR